MGAPKKNSASIKATDGRKNNGRKRGTVVRKQKKYTPAKMNQAKRDRIKVYTINAIIDEFGSEEDFFGWLAERARKSNYHLGKLMDYGFGNPDDYHGEARTLDKVNINFFGNTNINQGEKKQLDVLDIEAVEVDEEVGED